MESANRELDWDDALIQLLVEMMGAYGMLQSFRSIIFV